MEIRTVRKGKGNGDDWQERTRGEPLKMVMEDGRLRGKKKRQWTSWDSFVRLPAKAGGGGKKAMEDPYRDPIYDKTEEISGGTREKTRTMKPMRNGQKANKIEGGYKEPPSVGRRGSEKRTAQPRRVQTSIRFELEGRSLGRNLVV